MPTDWWHLAKLVAFGTVVVLSVLAVLAVWALCLYVTLTTGA